MFEAPRQIQSAIAGAANVPVGFAPTGEIDFQKLLSVLWEGRATIAWTTAASLVAVMLFVLVVPRSYSAVTQILIEPTDLRAVNNDLTANQTNNEVAVLQVESQVRVLMSDSVLGRVVKTEMLDRDPEFVGRWLGSGADSTTAAVNTLKHSISVKRAERTYVVDVERDRARARQGDTHRQRHRPSLPDRANQRALGRRPPGFAISVRTPQRAQGARAPSGGPRRNLQGEPQYPRRQRTTGRRTAAVRGEQSARTGARAHSGGEGAVRPNSANTIVQGRNRRLPGGDSVANHYRVARPICRGYAPRSRTDDFARRAPSGSDRDSGASGAFAAHDRGRGPSGRAFRAQRI